MKPEMVVAIIASVIAIFAVGVAGQTMMELNKLEIEVIAIKSNLDFVMKQEPMAGRREPRGDRPASGGGRACTN